MLKDPTTPLRPPSSSEGSSPDLARGEELSNDPLIGARLGEYVVEARIGLGGMGIVYRGRQPEIGKSVAIKVLRPEIADEPIQVNRLLSEARVVNAIGHRGIVDIFSFGRLPDGRTYFVMELLQGEPLDVHLSRRGALPVEEAVPLLEDLLTVLGAAHATGVVHRDLKPSNLFLVRQSDGASFLKILDFGLAKNTAATGRSLTSGMIVGTPEFMAPEQIIGEPVTPRTDLYSVGVIAYQLLTGKLPFESATSIAYLVLHLEKEPTPLSQFLPDLDPELAELVLRLLAKSPDDRPPSAEQVRLELRGIRMRLQASGVPMKERAFDSGASPRSGPEPSEARPRPTPRPKPPGEARDTVSSRPPRPKAPTMPDAAEPLGPPTIDERYSVLDKLGSGGMAAVWRARDQRLGRDVAIKVMHPHLASGPARQRFEREAQIAASLGHENVLQVFDFSASEPFDSYIAMELVEGKALRSHLEEKGAIAPGLAAAIGIQVARALAYAHSRNVIHRDVKPENVMLSRQGQVKLGDFGIAGVGDAVRQTTAGVVMGTPSYLAPEQVQGQTADARTDIYSLGVLLYELVTGTQAFAGDSVAALMYKIVENDYARPETFPGMDKAVAAVINRCLSKERKARFQTADEVVAALKPIAHKHGIEDAAEAIAAYAAAQPPSSRGEGSGRIPAPAPKEPRRAFPLKSVGIGAGALALVAGSALVGARFLARPAQPPALAPGVHGPIPAARPPEAARPTAAVVAPATGGLQVIAHGGWLDVSIDGKPNGRTPLAGPLKLPAGPHTVVVTNSFKRFKKTENVTVKPGAVTLVELDLGQAGD